MQITFNNGVKISRQSVKYSIKIFAVRIKTRGIFLLNDEKFIWFLSDLLKIACINLLTIR